MTGSDEADDGGDDVEDEDLDELAPVTSSSSSLRTAQEQDGGTGRIVERGDGQAEADRDELDELAPVTSAVRTAQSQFDAGADDDGDEECGGDD